jgi:hypothetical protein
MKAIASSTARTGSAWISTWSTIRLLSKPANRPARIHASGNSRSRSLPKRSNPPTVGTGRPWCLVDSQSVSRSRRDRARTGANDSEAARKSNASESRSGIGCSSNASPRLNRRSSSIRSASARRLVEPTRT